MNVDSSVLNCSIDTKNLLKTTNILNDSKLTGSLEILKDFVEATLNEAGKCTWASNGASPRFKSCISDLAMSP